MHSVLANIPCTASTMACCVAASNGFFRDLELGAASVKPWQYPRYVLNDPMVSTNNPTPPATETQQGDARPAEATTATPPAAPAPAAPPNPTTSRRRAARRPLELGVRSKGFRKLFSREFMTPREIRKFVEESEPSNNRRDGISVLVERILIGGIAAMRSEDIKEYLRRCSELIIRHIWQKDTSNGRTDVADAKCTIDPVLDKCCKKRLHTLEVSWCRLELAGVKILTHRIGELNNIRTLRLCDLKLNQEGMSLVVKVTKKLPLLEHLELRRNSLEGPTFIVVLRALCSSKTLQYLDLSSNNVSSMGVEDDVAAEIVTLLTHLVALKTFLLRGMDFKQVSAKKFGEAILPPELRVLDIGDHYELKGDGSQHLLRTVKNARKLEILKFDRCCMETTVAIDLCNSIRAFPIVHLDLCYNRITSECGRVLARAVAHYPHMTFLDLSGNPMRSDGVIPILHVLARGGSPKLSYLGIGQMHLDDEITISLAMAIRNCKELIELILGYNYLSTAATIIITRALSEFTPLLEVLDLRGNEIDEDILDPLVTLAKSMTSLQYLYMVGNPRISRGVLMELKIQLRNAGLRVAGVCVSDEVRTYQVGFIPMELPPDEQAGEE